MIIYTVLKDAFIYLLKICVFSERRVSVHCIIFYALFLFIIEDAYGSSLSRYNTNPLLKTNLESSSHSVMIIFSSHFESISHKDLRRQLRQICTLTSLSDHTL